MRGGFHDFDAALLGKPSVESDRCAVCGRWATNRHHVVEKGMGGVGKSEALVPRISLCGSGTTGCHWLVHAGMLHLYWSESMGGWVFHRTAQPADHFRDWFENRSEYRPLPGWVRQKVTRWNGRTFGAGCSSRTT